MHALRLATAQLHSSPVPCAAGQYGRLRWGEYGVALRQSGLRCGVKDASEMGARGMYVARLSRSLIIPLSFCVGRNFHFPSLVLLVGPFPSPFPISSNNTFRSVIAWLLLSA
jgi:hypothetical protein